MKEFYLPLLFLAAGCSTYIPSAQLNSRPASSLTDLPMKPHNREVQVYFDAEKPSEPYYKIKLVETSGPADISMDALLLRLKRIAQDEGIDALLVSNISRQGGMVSSGEFPARQLSAIGIRFKRTIDYMDTIVKAFDVSWWKDDNAEPKEFNIEYDMHGNRKNTNDPFLNTFYLEQLYPYEGLGIGFGPIDGWDYKLDSQGYLVSKRRLGINVISLKCNYYYQDGRLQKEEIIAPPSPDGVIPRKKYLLLPEYNMNGSLVSRSLWADKELVWTDRFSYRLNGMPDKMTRFATRNEKAEKIFELRFSYYAASDLPATEL